MPVRLHPVARSLFWTMLLEPCIALAIESNETVHAGDADRRVGEEPLTRTADLNRLEDRFASAVAKLYGPAGRRFLAVNRVNHPVNFYQVEGTPALAVEAIDPPFVADDLGV